MFKNKEYINLSNALLSLSRTASFSPSNKLSNVSIIAPRISPNLALVTCTPVPGTIGLPYSSLSQKSIILLSWEITILSLIDARLSSFPNCFL